ncbi:transmembrane protease serine 11G-like [Hemicordylus capensis]|uniref:transmembrane protease serine 11G-like n=1 Tax=Hemicordylus capensis TaxID=884348 RepID=UPI0023027E17|nr:transmembrane protease serine 11G-like [Hemicordylus capensis]
MKDLPLTAYPARRCDSCIFQQHSQCVHDFIQTGSGAHIVYQSYHHGPWDLQRTRQSARKPRDFEGWKIALIILGIALAAAIAIILLAFFSQSEQRIFYYNSNFKISGIQYSPALSRQSSDKFRDVGNWIEKLMYETFHNSILRHKYKGSRLVRVSVPQLFELALGLPSKHTVLRKDL